MATNDIDIINQAESQTLPLAVPATDEGYIALLSQRPPWLVRWGILLFACIVGLLLAATWFIRHPDRVSASGILMASNMPQDLVVRTDGRLQHLFYNDGDSVQQGRLLAVMQSTANYEHILTLQRVADSLQADLTAGNSKAAISWHLRLKNLAPVLNAGELQGDLQQLMAALQTFTQYLAQGYFLRKKEMLHTDLDHLAAQRKVLQKQLALTRQDMALAADNFAASDKLASQKVIAPVEYRNEQSKWVNKQLQGPQVEAALISNQMQAHEKQKEIAQLDNEIAQQTELFIQALQQWRAQLAAWQQQYLIVSPGSGRLSLNGFLKQGTTLQRGEIVGSVVPANAGYYVAVTLPQYNFGKLRLGQQALLRFTAFPFEEFGSVEARLAYVKTLPTDSGYLGMLELPNGLVSDKGITLAYRHGLKAQAEIITDQRRLLERLLEGITKAMKR